MNENSMIELARRELHLPAGLRQGGGDEEPPDGLMCSASCCTLCESCAIQDGESCRSPGVKWSCHSACCIFVHKLVERCGMGHAF